MMRTRTKKPSGQTTALEAGKLPPPAPAARSQFSSIPKGWKPAAEALDYVRAISTIFPDFNRASRIGGVPSRRIITVHGPSHGGKAQSVESPVLTPTGWRPIGELKVGDLVVGRNGAPTEVTGVFPQGIRLLYRVLFSDGSAVTCCAEHLWSTITKEEWFAPAYTRGPRPERRRIKTGLVGEGSVRTLAEVMRDPPRTHEVPLVDPVEYEPAGELPIDPYLLGLLLGDGNFAPTALRFCKPEKDLRSRVIELVALAGDHVSVPDSMTLGIVGGATRLSLKLLGLEHHRSWEKFVPHAYRFASVEARIALLRGLFDTDGHVVRKGNCRVEYSTTSPELALHVVELVRGLGGIAKTRWFDAGYVKNGQRIETRPAARIDVWFQNGIVPVSSAKHLKRWGVGRDRVRRTMIRFEPIGERECVCIRVAAADSLYVTEDFIVTHNSAFVAGLLRSYVDAGHVAAYVDAEHATDLAFLDELFERPVSEIPNFFGERPSSYEETIDKVDDLLKWMVAERKVRRGKSKLPLPPDEDLAGIIFIDSLNKLVPEREIKELKAKGGDAINKGWGMLRANYNQAALDHWVPLLREAEMTLGLVVQERDDDDLEPWEMPKLKGGKATQFDASMIVRVMKSSAVKRGSSEEDKEVFGFRHRLRLWKSKVGHMDGRWSDSFFHLSNGKLIRSGFDTARDAVEVGRTCGIVSESGSWLTWNKNRWNGSHVAVQKLTADPEKLAELLRQVNEATRSRREP
jgi:RecA/RadA recombinase